MRRLTTWLLVLIAAGGAGSGCAGGGAARVDTPLSADLASCQILAVKVHAADPAFLAEVRPLAEAILERLPPGRPCATVVDQDLSPATGADIGLSVQIRAVTRVTKESRMMAGAMAGKAKVLADVRVVRIPTRELLGAATVEGKSSGGSIFAGTTEDAIGEAASQVAAFVLGQR